MGTSETLNGHVVELVENLSLDTKGCAGKASPADEPQNPPQPEAQAAAKEEVPQRPEQADDECVKKFEAAINATVRPQVQAKVLSELRLLAPQTDGKWQTLLRSPSEKAVQENSEVAARIVKLLIDSEFPGAQEVLEAVGILDDKVLDQLRTRLFRKVGGSVKLESLLTVKAVRFENPFMTAFESPHFTPRQFHSEGQCEIVRANPPRPLPNTKIPPPPTPPRR